MIGNFVPYLGADDDVSIGDHNFKAVTITAQLEDGGPATPALKVEKYEAAIVGFEKATISVIGNINHYTEDIEIQLPITGGTLALLSDILAGTSGTDGTSGSSGTDGTSGSSGTDGTSGTSGIIPSIGNDTELLFRDDSATYDYNTSSKLTYDDTKLRVADKGFVGNSSIEPSIWNEPTFKVGNYLMTTTLPELLNFHSRAYIWDGDPTKAYSAGFFQIDSMLGDVVNYTNRFVALEGIVDHNANANISHTYGCRGASRNWGTGTIEYAYGGQFAIHNKGTGTITEAIGCYIFPTENVSGGTITRNYGLYIREQETGVSNYSIYTEAGDIRFGELAGSGTRNVIVNSAGILAADTGDLDIVASTFKVGDVVGGDYASFNVDGELRLYGEATQWADLRVPITSTKKGGSKDPDFEKMTDNGSGSQGVFVEYFNPTIEEEIYFEVQLPHSWKEGSDILPHVHWTPKTAGAAGEDVCWGLEYVWSNIGDNFGNTTIIYGDTTIQAETLVANKHYLTELGTMTGTTKEISSMISCRLFRDATGAGGTDDYTDDAGLLEIDFHYQIDSLGSNEEYIKY
jgi:hypothetical protein